MKLPTRKFSLKWWFTKKLYDYFWNHPVFEDAEYHEDFNGSWYQEADPFYREDHMGQVDTVSVWNEFIHMHDFGGSINARIGRIRWDAKQPRFIHYPKWLIRVRRVIDKMRPIDGNIAKEWQFGPIVVQLRTDGKRWRPSRYHYRKYLIYGDWCLWYDKMWWR